MGRYLLRIARRRSWTLSLLTVFGVAVGVASVLAIQILNRNAIAAFAGSVQAISGRADLTVLPRTPALSDSQLIRVLETPGVAAAWPLYRVEATLAGRRDAFLEIVGLDFLALDSGPALPGSDLPATGERVAFAPLTVPGWVAITPELSRELSRAVGDTLGVTSGSRRATLRVGAVVDLRKASPLGTSRLVLMDIAQAQELAGHPDRLDQIDVRIARGATPDSVARALTAALGPRAEVLAPDEVSTRAEGLLGAFRLNLTALSLVSLFVGTFLVFISTQASLVRRRSELGLLRALGATRGQILFVLGTDVLLLAAIGVALGIPLGYWVAIRNVGSVSATISNIYLLAEIDRVVIPPALYASAWAIGIGGAAAGAPWPAWDALRRDARSLFLDFTLHETTRRGAPLAALAALVMDAVGAIWFWRVGQGTRPAGFVLGFLVLVSIPLLAPAWVRLLGTVARARGLGLRFSLRNLTVRLHTVAFAVAGVAVAVAMMVGVTCLIASFRSTLVTWIETSVRADVYVTTPSWSRGRDDAFLAPEILSRIESVPGVAGIERLRQVTVEISGHPVRISGVEAAPGRAPRFPLRDGDPEKAARAVWDGNGTLISEPLAAKLGLGVGDSLRFTAPTGPVALPIAGVSYDYSTEAGSALISLATMEEALGPAPIQNVALYLHDGVSVTATLDSLRSRLPDVPLVLRSNGDLRRDILEIFDQTFAITRILQGLALLVALSGISLTLLVLARERAPELALYRALGALRRQVFGLFLGEALTMGALGLVLGTIAGIGLALILVHVINPAFFGWTIHPAWPWKSMLVQGAMLLGSALIAGLYPAARASRLTAKELSRDEL
ncbi:MAG: ABC transporter permease [Candidatus Eisenbacteria bacterium]|uniref:ABC transporter permease n=1 Tax=Eiseniibacteriota bacterium TaxID=2212470 RepID=A0A956LZ66_UNCEI|nr:ABC transporter permease [Candidatus Eisenbacteria bacterium]